MSILKNSVGWAGLSDDARKMFRHDLKGSVSVFDGFHVELQEALQELDALLEGGKTEQQQRCILQIFKDDIDPCLTFLEKTAAKMNERIELLQALCSKPRE